MLSLKRRLALLPASLSLAICLSLLGGCSASETPMLSAASPASPPVDWIPVLGSEAGFGYSDRDGHMTIEPRFAFSFPFVGNHAAARERGSGLWGMIGTDGTWLVEPRFMYIHYTSKGVEGINWESGRRITLIEGGFGMSSLVLRLSDDREERFLLAGPSDTTARPAETGKKRDAPFEKVQTTGGRWTVWDRTQDREWSSARLSVREDWKLLLPLPRGRDDVCLIVGEMKSGRLILYSKEGREAGPFLNETLINGLIVHTAERFWVLNADRKWGALDCSGRTVIPFLYDKALRPQGFPDDPVVTDVVAVQREGQWFYVDKTGREYRQ